VLWRFSENVSDGHGIIGGHLPGSFLGDWWHMDVKMTDGGSILLGSEQKFQVMGVLILS